MSLLLLNPRTRQPHGGLVAPQARVLLYGESKKWNSAVNALGTENHSTLFTGRGTGSYGRLIDVSAHTVTGLNLTSKAPDTIDVPVCYLLSIRPASTDGDIFSRYHKLGATSAHAGMWCFEKSGSNLVFRWSDGSLQSRTITGVSLSTGVSTTICAKFVGGNATIYQDGRLQDSFAYTVPTLGTSTSVHTITIGKATSNAGSFRGGIYLAAVLDPNVDARRLSNNPWQIFPPQRKIWVPDAGGGVTVSGNPDKISTVGITGSVIQQLDSIISGQPVVTSNIGVSGSVTQQLDAIIASKPGGISSNAIPGAILQQLDNIILGEHSRLNQTGISGSVTQQLDSIILSAPGSSLQFGIDGSVVVTTDILIEGYPGGISQFGVIGAVVQQADIVVSGVPDSIFQDGVSGTALVTNDIVLSGTSSGVSVNGISGNVLQNSIVSGLPGGLSITAFSGATVQQTDIIISGNHGEINITGTIGATLQSAIVSGGFGEISLTGLSGSVPTNIIVSGAPGEIFLSGISGITTIGVPEDVDTTGILEFITPTGIFEITTHS